MKLLCPNRNFMGLHFHPETFFIIELHMQNNPHEHFFSISGSVMFSKNSSLHYFVCVDYKQPDKEDAQLSWLLMLCCVVMFCQSGCPCFFVPERLTSTVVIKSFVFLKLSSRSSWWTHTKKRTQVQLNCGRHWIISPQISVPSLSHIAACFCHRELRYCPAPVAVFYRLVLSYFGVLLTSFTSFDIK